MDWGALKLRPMAELPTRARDNGVTLVYAADRDWDLWLLDPEVALDTPDDFVGWLERSSVAEVLAAINKR